MSSGCQQVIDSQSERMAAMATDRELAALGRQDESTGQGQREREREREGGKEGRKEGGRCNGVCTYGRKLLWVKVVIICERLFREPLCTKRGGVSKTLFAGLTRFSLQCVYECVDMCMVL